MKPLFTIVCLLWLSYLSALAQPRDLRAETVPSTLKIRLTWTDNTLNETKFEIERAVSTSNDFNVIGSVNRNVVTYEDVDPAKEPSTLYKYRVRGIISEALGIKLGTDYSNVASARTSGPPDRPVVTRKTALRVPNSEKMAGVKLEWTDNADDEIGYFVNYKKYGSSTYTNVALPPNTRSYEIRVAEGEAWPGCDGRIEFTVMCYNLAGQIEATDKRFDAPDVDKPSTPQNLRATASIVDSKAAINLTWAGTNTAESVENRVYVRISKGDAASARVITLLNTSLNSHVIDTGLEFGATYKIEIWANNCAGNSPYSNDVTITTPANPANTPPAAPEIHSSLSQNWTRNSDRVTEVTALWHDRSNNETGFEIQWGTTEQFADGTASVDANITQHKIEGSWPGCGQKVYVRVRAKHAIRPSTWSETYVTTSIAIPEPPNNVEATPKSSSEIELKWGGANESYSRESGFIIQYSTSSSFSSPVQTTADQNANGKTIGGLNANTTYYFRVKTQNCAGESGWSNTDNARTQEATTQAPSAPSELVLTPLLANNMNNVRLSWRDNSNNETGFEVESSTNGTTFSRATTTAANVTQYEINLTTSTKNYFRVRAITGAQQSGYSNVVDYDMGPESPLDLRATVISSSQINLAWSDRSTDETGYEVERSTDGTSFSRIATVGTNVVTYQNTGLTASTTYHYRVRGLKGSAGSAYTHIVNARTQGGTTSPPTAPMIDGSLSQNWTRNADRVTEITASWQDRSNNETGFDIQWGENDQYTGGLASVDANMTQHKIEGSWPGCGHKIYVRVRAKNAGGESAWSAATVTTSIAIPEPPSNVTATARSSSEAEVKWGGANESYSRESYFVIQYSNNHEPTETSGISVTVAQNSSSAVINVGPNTQYYVRVRAENCAGKSGWSTLIPVRTPAGPPATPTDLVAVATSQTVVELAWKYKTLPGFSVTFDVQRSDDGGATFNSLPVGTLAFTANASGDISGKYTNSGLTPSATYQYRVRAKTPFESAFSNLFTITMPAVPITSPAVPTNLVASATSASQINLTWNDASNNEDGFDIERSTDNVAWGNSVSVGVNTTTYAVNGLNASTKYFFRVRAKNSVGTSGWSNVADATTQAPPVTITKPTTPTSLKATASSTTQIDLSWTDASNNEEGFDIERSADNVTWGNSASAGVNAVTYAATGLNASTKYYFRVRSKNSAGASEWSNVAEATTQATSTTTLTAPSNLTVSLVNNVALLVWQDNTANETGFQVEQSVNGGNFEKLVELGANVFLYKDESLRAQSTYAYRVRAYRAMLMSDYSNTAEVRFIVTAIGPPPAESKLYPNPATNVLHYTVGSGTNPQMLRIRDTSGRLMQEIPLSGRVQEVEVPVSQLNTGTYYLEVIGNQKPQFFRFIKQ